MIHLAVELTPEQRSFLQLILVAASKVDAVANGNFEDANEILKESMSALGSHAQSDPTLYSTWRFQVMTLINLKNDRFSNMEENAALFEIYQAKFPKTSFKDFSARIQRLPLASYDKSNLGNLKLSIPFLVKCWRPHLQLDVIYNALRFTEIPSRLKRAGEEEVDYKQFHATMWTRTISDCVPKSRAEWHVKQSATISLIIKISDWTPGSPHSFDDTELHVVAILLMALCLVEVAFPSGTMPQHMEVDKILSDLALKLIKFSDQLAKRTRCPAARDLIFHCGLSLREVPEFIDCIYIDPLYAENDDEGLGVGIYYIIKQWCKDLE
ncbi:unnamed protein product [Clonostachys rhizophaga]|uniref:Uncharacterized protein n=1 Tax=Clonostachys rhizophaga TaxID=160324 RepID=A0A9N9VHK5_9HYPO|nr:unnamed protein product [Clonostachys rhizophaga]